MKIRIQYDRGVSAPAGTAEGARGVNRYKSAVVASSEAGGKKMIESH